jgi:hypothetical protein
MMTSRIYLKDNASGKMVAAELIDVVSDDQLAMWDATWKPAMKAHCAGRALADCPQDRHWD